ncbi:hypothetical protein J437_LFUL000656 [Ladona fulva]|uniref:D-isomer specific 2-hydroxyacid dehydrogenase NAD-binding domain-containing protein n=1 Tax=Ladona fulva TaxID=123851 RepID=A0A8K0NZ94_LADFU|nr:hypothetical protein J437_LFUL000656 [Ladona fulva]
MCEKSSENGKLRKGIHSSLLMETNRRVVPVLTRREGLTFCLRKQLPQIEFKELNPAENEDDLNTLKRSEIIISDADRICTFLYELPATRWIQGTWAGADLYRKYIDKNEVRNVDELPELLSSCDYVCNILPSTDSTKGLLGNGMLKHCYGKGTIFMNIGRGSIISEKDLIEALNEKWIAGAILDVFEGEPLDPRSPLWSMPQPRLPFQITRFSGPSFGILMGEYVVCQIIIHERDFFKIHQNQSKKLWLCEGKIFEHRMLADLSIGILGFGAIGVRVAQLLKTFNPKVWVLVRSVPSEIEKQPYVDEYSNHVTVTPHVSGVIRPQDVAKLFAKNLELYESGQPLEYVYDVEKGY